MHPTDEQLVTAYLERADQIAFKQLVDRYQSRIFGYLLGMVRDRDVANDLFQETFLRVISAMHNERGSYTRQGRWSKWVMMIARNAALDYLRSRKKWQDVRNDNDDEGTSFWDRLPDTEPSAEDLFHTAEQRALLEDCIAQLPHEQREVLLLRHEGDFTFREIAEMTDVSINTALGRMRYALLNLRKMIETSKKKPLANVA